ncbi:glycosyltransferase family A protein [Adlercreutzia sp. ZJ141]|uniref:glycosyltransferase family A protein n=1 Tax=Adlercreutzia sp. ZJ141 TaxID=2709406 RepID=UPI0013EB870A|nr:glycosyltransferase family A protein [Adlercreutzia sp. ZJ141]
MFSSADHTFAICAYGESPYLSECVRSLKTQTIGTNIVMATSTPNNLIENVARDNDIPLFINPQKLGIASDWNFAANCASTPLVTIAHQDDTYEPTYAEKMLAGMNRTTRPLIFFTNYGELRHGVKVDNHRLLTIKRILLLPISRSGVASSVRKKRGILSKGSSICCPSVTLNMNALPNPPFSTGMKSNLDWDAWERFSHLDGQFVYDKTILMYHRIHQDSETSALIRDNTRTQEDFEMLARFWPRPIAWIINKAYSKGQVSNNA